MPATPSTGILALQGCIDPHLTVLNKLNIPAVKVRTVEDLKRIDRIILPGGESTAMLKLLARTGLENALIDFAHTNPVWGICAGSILLASKVSNPSQRSWGLINIHAMRNYYGSQRESFKTTLSIPSLGEEFLVDFIRAPKLEPLGSEVEVLAKHESDAVLLRAGNILVSSFHIELGDDTRLHQYFAEL